MTLFLYEKEFNGAAERLRRVIETFMSKEYIEVFRDINDLSYKLRQPQASDDTIITVLVASNGEDLSDILSIRDLLDDVRVIMVLPDREEVTIAKGHILRPRFITYTDSDFTEVGEVLKKMFETP